MPLAGLNYDDMKNCFTILLIPFLLLIFTGCDETTGGVTLLEGPMQNIDIEKAIGLVQNQKHKKMLRDFKNSFSKKDSFIVTSLEDQFEIIVTHPSTDGFTGGAEQYLLDKQTGKYKMGWHEHPMQFSKPQKINDTAQ